MIHSGSTIGILLSVVIIDITLSVDNTLVMAAAAARLPLSSRKRAIGVGVGAAVFFRIVLAILALRLLSVVGLAFAGGLLLLWVAWKLWRDLKAPESSVRLRPTRSDSVVFSRVILEIIFADLSMSLDNSIAIAGVAQNHLWIMIAGLALSVAMMGIAANFLAGLINRNRWLSYLGIGIVLYVAVSMIWLGTHGILGMVFH